MASLDIHDLSFCYPQAKDNTLESISLHIESGELVTVIGPTGSGKSTLLRLIKPELRQNGTLTGTIALDGADITRLSPAESARCIGYVTQNPEEQIVTDQVWHELAFTLENLGEKQDVIARRVAEIAAYFGIEAWFRRPTSELSGGQKQLLNLAAVMTADPELLILDEPTAQLDPISAERLIDAIRRLNRETGVSVIITEHRAEELIPISDRLIILDRGKITFDGHPRRLADRLTPEHPYLRYLPCAAQVYAMTGGEGDCPLSLREGRAYLSDAFHHTVTVLGADSAAAHGEPALELKDVFFRYERRSPDILKGLSMTVYRGEVFALLGANAAGKSTAIGAAAGLRRPYSGRITLFGKALKDYRDGTLYQNNISLLPQDAESVFLHMSVREELKGCDAAMKRIPYDFEPLLDRHPYDLSGGERQLVALCRALSTEPRLLLLDEPSKGLDPDAKERLAALIRQLADEGVTVLTVSHDISFAARCADRCALLFDGAIAAVGDTAQFLSSNRFYTSPTSRMTRGLYEDAYTPERAAQLALKNGRRV